MKLIILFSILRPILGTLEQEDEYWNCNSLFQAFVRCGDFQTKQLIIDGGSYF